MTDKGIPEEIAGQLEELLDAYRDQEYSPHGAALLEEGIDKADACNAERFSVVLRAYYVHDSDRNYAPPQKTVTHFSWLLAYWDREPGSDWLDVDNMMWWYKWIPIKLVNTPAIPLATIYAVLDDMHRRFEEFGYSLRPVYNLRSFAARLSGHHEDYVRWTKMWTNLPSDEMTDCDACDLDDRASFLLETGEEAKALDLWDPILKGEMTCASIPHSTFAIVLLPLWRAGRVEEADRYQKRGYELIQGEAHLSKYLREHILYLLKKKEYAAACQIMEKNFARYTKPYDPMTELGLAAAFHLLFETLDRNRAWDTRDGRLPLRIPAEFALYEADGLYEPARLSAHFHDRTQDLGAQFDRRNGNTHYRDKFELLKAEYLSA